MTKQELRYALEKAEERANLADRKLATERDVVAIERGRNRQEVLRLKDEITDLTRKVDEVNALLDSIFECKTPGRFLSKWVAVEKF